MHMRQLGSVRYNSPIPEEARTGILFITETDQWRRSSVEIIIQGAEILARPHFEALAAKSGEEDYGAFVWILSSSHCG